MERTPLSTALLWEESLRFVCRVLPYIPEHRSIQHCQTLSYSVFFLLQTLSYNPNIPSEEEKMKDDSLKWALVFFILGVYSSIGLFFQVSFIINLLKRVLHTFRVKRDSGYALTCETRQAIFFPRFVISWEWPQPLPGLFNVSVTFTTPVEYTINPYIRTTLIFLLPRSNIPHTGIFDLHYFFITPVKYTIF